MSPQHDTCFRALPCDPSIGHTTGDFKITCGANLFGTESYWGSRPFSDHKWKTKAEKMACTKLKRPCKVGGEVGANREAICIFQFDYRKRKTLKLHRNGGYIKANLRKYSLDRRVPVMRASQWQMKKVRQAIFHFAREKWCEWPKWKWIGVVFVGHGGDQWPIAVIV